MIPVLALTIIIGVFAVGEIVAQKTKAVLSTTLVAAVLLLIGFWTIIPHTLLEDSKAMDIANVLIGVLIVSQGTIISFKELKTQWKTVIISLACVIISVVGIIFIGNFIIGRNMVLAGAPIFAGANVAVLIMTQTLAQKGLETLGLFCVIVLVTQNFIGIPIASLLLRKEASAFLKDTTKFNKYLNIEEDKNLTKKRKLLELPDIFDKPSVHLTKLGIIATFAFYISGLTNGNIHYLVVALLMGILFTELGFLQPGSLNKTQSGTITIILTTAVIFGNLTKATPNDILTMIWPLIVVMGIGILFTCITGVIVGKILKESSYLCIALGLTCTFGFPTTMLMPTEVAEAFGKNINEVTAIKNYLTPKLLTAGFVTVTIASVVVAGFVAGMI